jgi:hypothetical protein
MRQGANNVAKPVGVELLLRSVPALFDVVRDMREKLSGLIPERVAAEERRRRAVARSAVKTGTRDVDDERDPLFRGARERERARVSTIIKSAAARRWPSLAIHIATRTTMPRHAAIAFIAELGDLLDSNSGGSPQTLADAIILAGHRARGEVPNPVTAPEQRRGHVAAAQILAAGRKARGEV